MKMSGYGDDTCSKLIQVNLFNVLFNFLTTSTFKKQPQQKHDAQVNLNVIVEIIMKIVKFKNFFFLHPSTKSLRFSCSFLLKSDSSVCCSCYYISIIIVIVSTTPSQLTN